MSPTLERRSPRWVLPVVIGLVVLAGLAVGFWGVNLPFYAFSAGPSGDAVGSIEIQETEIFQPKGELIYLTVALQQVNAFEALAAALDPTIDLAPEDRIRPKDQTDEDFKRKGLADMDESERTAIAVALEELGYQSELLGDGAEVISVVEGSGAVDKLKAGDVIVAIDRQPVQVVDDISRLLKGRTVGDRVEVGLDRSGSRISVEIALFAAPDEITRPIIGIEAATKNLQTETPFPIDIETSNLGGPSAGLMYTLAIIDLLSPGDLTKGHVIAGTGTISSDRQVGAIGGIRQKLVAAAGAGAEFVFVPADNYQTALTVELSSTELVKVATLDDALAFLAGLSAA